MVYYKRKRTATKPAANKRRRIAPRAKMTKMPRLNATMIQRTTFAGTWAFDTIGINGFWRYWTTNVAQMNNWAEFKPVFDEYKINAIKYTFRPRYDSYEGAVPTPGTPGYPLAYAHVIKDPASTNIPSGVYNGGTVNSFLENGNVKTYTLNKPFSIYFRPKIASQVFGGGTASSMVSTRFIKSTDDVVDHRGFHMLLQNNNLTGTNPSVQLDVFITYYVSLKGLR